MSLPTPYYSDDWATIYLSDCADVVPLLGEVGAIIADPPYFNVLDETWDRQWRNAQEFLDWLAVVADGWRRVLAFNGSLYCFASPDMAARVEVMLGERFQVLNSIRWVKPDSILNRAEVAALRSYLSPWEACIFAEQYGADGSALQGSGYDSACANLRAGVFEPLRQYLDAERDASGWSVRQVAEAYQKVTGSRTVTGMAGHWFQVSQWSLPTEQNYVWLRDLFNGGNGGGHLRREYEDLRREYEDLRREYEDLRREYEDLRREYEDLRRPFTLDQFTSDVWHYDSAPQGTKRTHPAAKPEAMLRHMIERSTRPDTTILDPFMGAGTTLRAAKDLGRKSIGIEVDERYCEIAARRLGQEVLPFGDG